MGNQVNKTVAEIREDFRSKYNARKVYEWTGYADEPKEKPLVTLIEKIAKKQNLIPSYFYTMAIGEGLGLAYIDDLSSYKDISLPTEKPKLLLKTDLEINGFNALGVDDFGSEYPRYKKYLPKTYNMSTEKNKFSLDSEFYQEDRKNELGRTTKSAVFKDLESALWAFGSTVAHRKGLFIKHGKELGYKSSPTDDQTAYWIYVYFQGEGNAKRWLKSNGGYNITTKKTERGQVNTLATERLATWRYIQSKKLFSL